MKQLEQLSVAFRAKVGAIWVRSAEESRIMRDVAPVAESLRYQVMVWSVTKGLRPFGQEVIQDDATRDPSVAIMKLLGMRGRVIGVFADFSSWLNDPVARRTFIDAHRRITTIEKEDAKQIVCLDPNDAPNGILGLTKLDWPLPDRDECGAILDGIMEYASDAAIADVKTNGNREDLINAMVGLSSDDAANALSRSVAATGMFVPKVVAAEKARLVKGGGLEWHDPDPRGLEAVGGLDALKDWLVERRESFGVKAREYGLPAPKGAMLLGVPGGGKSLTAKCIATAWNLPLLRLDVGATFGKYVGESEKMIREALATAEAVSPCVLWVDEVEKAFAQGGGETDGGTTGRVFGTFLTWMQERTPGIFVLATSNDVSKLPPEFLRAGRWDALWFVDLPTQSERIAILKVMCKKFPHCEKVGALSMVATACEGFTGAEIEQLFSESLYVAFADGAREVNGKDLINAAKKLVPLSKTMGEKLKALRDWARGRARLATSDDAEYKPFLGNIRVVE